LQIAADALYVSNAQNIADGLTAVLASYARSPDPVQRRIYAIWTGQGRAQLGAPMTK
jgi:hypothetical protein